MANEIINRTVNIFIQSGEAQRIYDQLIAKQKKLNDQLAQNPKNAAKIKEELAKLEEPISRAAKKLSGELEPSLKDTQSTVTKLRRELSFMSESDPGYKQKVAQYAQANKELEAQRGKVGLLSKAWKSFAQEVKTVALGVIIGNSVQSVLQNISRYVTGIVTGSAKIADELSDIEKTTNLTKDQVEEVNTELSKIDTRTSASGLRQLAEEAGKLGKDSVEDIIKFVKEADQIKVALGEDLGDDAIISIGKLSKVFKEGILNIGSAINEIGASSEASEKFAVDFLNRLAGTGPAVKLSAADLLGYGAALEVTGQSAEVSGTALSTFFIEFVRDSEKFGAAAGFAQGELQKLINEKGTNGAFLEFLTRLKQSNPDMQQFLLRLQELGIDGSRGANVILALADHIEDVRVQQGIANEAMAAGTSLTDEFNKKNNNAAAELEKLRKNFDSLFTSSNVREGSAFVIRALNNLINLFKAIPFPVTIAGFTALASVLGLLTIAKLRAMVATARLTATQIVNTVTTRAVAIANQIAAASSVVYGFAMQVLTGRITIAAAAQRIWAAAASLGLGPIGLLIVAVGALAIGISSLVGHTQKLTAEQRIQAELAKRVADDTTETQNKIQTLTGVIKDHNLSLDVRKKALNDLIAISPNYLKGLTLENFETAAGKKILEDYNAELIKSSTLKAKNSLLDEKSKGQVEVQQNLLKIVKLSSQETAFPGLTKEIQSGKLGEAFAKALSFTNSTSKFGKLLSEFKDQAEEINLLSTDIVDAEKQSRIAAEEQKKKAEAEAKKTGVSIDSLKKQLETLRSLRDSATSDSDTKDTLGKTVRGRTSLNKEITETEKLIEKLEGKTTKLSSTEKKAANDTKAFAEELKQLALSLLPEGTRTERFEKEIQSLDDRYAKYREKAAGNGKLLLEIERLYQIERQKIIDKFQKEDEKNFAEALQNRKDAAAAAAKKQEEFINNLQPFLDRNIQRVNNTLTDIDADQKAKHDLDLAKAHGFKKLQMQLGDLKKEESQELTALDEKHRKGLISEEHYQNEVTRIHAEFSQKRILIIAAFVDGAANVFQEGLNKLQIFDQIRTNKENAELDRDRARNDKKKANLDKRLKNGLISQQQYDREVEKLNKQQEAREKAAKLKQFKRDQRASMVQAGIDGLRAVSKTLAIYGPPVPPNFLGIAAMAYTLLTTALQVKLIASKEPPAFAKGGKLSGRPHSQGGNPIIDGYTGRKIAEIEAEEAIINKFTMRDNTRYSVSGTPSQIASALNARHGGVSWASGATLQPVWKQQKPKPMNFSLIKSAQTFANGGVFRKFETGGNFKTESPSTTTTEQVNDTLVGLQAAIAIMIETNQSLNSQLAKGIVAKTFITDQEAQQDRLNNIRGDATFQP